MKVFVSGAAGFIGRAVTAELARRGHQVVAFDSNPFGFTEEEEEGALEIRGEGLLEKEEQLEEPESEEFVEEAFEYKETALPSMEGNVKYILGDLLKGGQWRSEILSCDKVISLTKPFSEREDITEREIHEYGNRHADEISSLLDAMAEGQAKTVLVTYDTLCLGEQKGETIRDTDRTDPVGFCKPLAESFKAVREALSEHRLNAVSVFPARVYGNGSWFNDLVVNIQRGNANIVEPGDNYLSLISIDDCAAIYADIVEKIDKDDSFILSDNNPVKQAELISFISRLLGVPAPAMISFEAYAKKFGRLESETMSASIKVSGEKVLALLDRELKYPRYEEGVMDMLESMGIEVRRRGAGLKRAA